MEIYPAIITLVVGILGSLLSQALVEWAGGGIVAAVAVMGYFILRDIRILKETIEDTQQEE